MSSGINSKIDVIDLISKGDSVVDKLFLEDDMCKMFNKELQFVKRLSYGADGEVFLVTYTDGETKQYVLKRTIHLLTDFPINQEQEQELRLGQGSVKSVLDKFSKGKYPYRAPQHIKKCLKDEKYSCKNNRYMLIGFNQNGQGEYAPGDISTGVAIVSEYIISKYLSNMYDAGSFFHFLEVSNFNMCENLKGVRTQDHEGFQKEDQASSFILMEKADGYIGGKAETLDEDSIGYDHNGDPVFTSTKQYDSESEAIFIESITYDDKGNVVQPLPTENTNGLIKSLPEDDVWALYLQCIVTATKLAQEGIVHHDLHEKNLMYVKVKPGMMWRGTDLSTVDYFSYTIKGDPIYFTSKYLIKVIDFGRSRWYDTTKDPPVVRVENGSLEEWGGLYPSEFEPGFDVFSIVCAFNDKLKLIPKRKLERLQLVQNGHLFQFPNNEGRRYLNGFNIDKLLFTFKSRLGSSISFEKPPGRGIPLGEIY